MMKKGVVLGGSAALLVALGAAAPYLIGLKAESSLRADHEILAQEIVFPGLAVTLDDYQRGYLGAEATTAITYTPDGREPVRLELRHHISHLPNPLHLAIASARSELVLPAELQQASDKLLNGRAPLTIDTYIGITGAQSAEISSPAFNTTLEENATTIEWKGLQGSGTRSGDASRLTNDLTLPGLVVSSADENFSLTDLHYLTDMRRGSYDLWFGSSEAALKSLQLSSKTAASPRTIAINDLHVTSEQQEAGLLTHGTVVAQFGKSTIGEVTLTSAVYDFEYRNFDTKTLSEIQASMRQAYSGGDEAILGAAIFGAIPSLLKAKPEINIRRLEVKSSMGNFNGKFHLAFTGDWNDEMLGNPMAILPMLNADLDLTITKSLLIALGHSQLRSSIAAMAEAQGEDLTEEEIDALAKERATQQLEVLAANDYLLEKGADYTTKIHFEKGQLTVNGKVANDLFGTPAR